jgi:hypothetical protein
MAAAEGKVDAVGRMDGTHAELSSVECFDPSTGQWSGVAAMSTVRFEHGVAVVDGKVYVTSGRDATITKLSSVECFDPSTGQWSGVAGGMSTARADLAVITLQCQT